MEVNGCVCVGGWGLSRNEAIAGSTSWDVMHRLLEGVSSSLGGLKCRDKSR